MPPATRVTRAPLIRRRLTLPGASPFDLVDWLVRAVQIHERDGSVAFACDDVEAPAPWSNLAVAIVARRYFGRDPGAVLERSVRTLVERVINAIARWAQEGSLAVDSHEREALHDELTALVLTQRATFATPVWLNAGLQQRPLTSACFILDTEDSIQALLQWNTREGLIFQQGGGAGINLSGIRSSREPVSRRGLARRVRAPRRRERRVAAARGDHRRGARDAART